MLRCGRARSLIVLPVRLVLSGAGGCDHRLLRAGVGCRTLAEHDPDAVRRPVVHERDRRAPAGDRRDLDERAVDLQA